MGIKYAMNGLQYITTAFITARRKSPANGRVNLS